MTNTYKNYFFQLSQEMNKDQMAVKQYEITATSL